MNSISIIGEELTEVILENWTDIGEIHLVMGPLTVIMTGDQWIMVRKHVVGGQEGDTSLYVNRP